MASYNLRNGYFKVNRAGNGELFVTICGANHEPLNHSETLKSWDSVITNITAVLRASNGRFCVVMDDTLENVAKVRLYHRLGVDKAAKLITIEPEEEKGAFYAFIDGLLAGPLPPHIGTHPRTTATQRDALRRELEENNVPVHQVKGRPSLWQQHGILQEGVHFNFEPLNIDKPGFGFVAVLIVPEEQKELYVVFGNCLRGPLAGNEFDPAAPYDNISITVPAFDIMGEIPAEWKKKGVTLRERFDFNFLPHPEEPEKLLVYPTGITADHADKEPEHAINGLTFADWFQEVGRLMGANEVLKDVRPDREVFGTHWLDGLTPEQAVTFHLHGPTGYVANADQENQGTGKQE